MRFQYLLSLSFLAASLTPVLALPFRSSEISSYKTRDVEDDIDLLFREALDIDERDLSEDLHTRDFLNTLVPRDKTYRPKTPAIKKTAEEAKQRKDGVRDAAKKSQDANKLKKADLQQKFKDAGEPRYGKPRKVGKPNEPGYRAKGRAGGHRLPKQPKTPKADMVKGQAKSAKAIKTQADALAKKKARLQEGRTKFGDAAAAQKTTTGLPGRMDEFAVKGENTYTGKDVRTANFNSNLFKSDPVGQSPKEFQNRLQGPPGSQAKPLPSMVGVGQEFPLTAGQPGGYQGGAKSAARIITQEHTALDGTKTTSFGGVIAHDVTKKDTDPGFNDHFQVPADHFQVHDT